MATLKELLGINDQMHNNGPRCQHYVATLTARSMQDLVGSADLNQKSNGTPRLWVVMHKKLRVRHHQLIKSVATGTPTIVPVIIP
jgi:hypothetical protein